ncbi:MAG: hypothetical protein UU25_C0004G0013 [Microgenomates group bacterium GW2011_GWB1_40_9]|nr:MAG: hypothetical protein UT26_C0007G0013 [Microgenomates group bacterium GW2011_GWC1_39_12]KKR79983.1 MAG: hypothetical protein UU25_C0004G0013 [Microgenomates group bacterium GW2011_GWB1_40_9]
MYTIAHILCCHNPESYVYNKAMKREWRRFFELVFVMTEKELRARYKYTIFGFFWLVLNPLLQMLVIGFIFTFFMKETIPHYYFYLLIGLLVWNFFSLSLTKTTPSIVNERSLIKKASFPRAVIPLSIILANLFHLTIAIFLYCIPLAFIIPLSISRIPYFFLSFCLLLIFTIGASLCTSALNVKYRDINFFVQAFLTIWFYATPIIYSFSIIPTNMLWLWRLNPMTSIMQLFQHVFVNTPLPDVMTLIINALFISIVALIGIILFHNESKNFDDWI